MRAKVRLNTAEEEAEIQRGIDADPDSRALTAAELAEMRPAAEVMPAKVYAGLVKRGRPPGATPARVLMTLRVPVEVRDTLRGTGPGWQTRAVEVLTRMAARDPALVPEAGTYVKQPRPDGPPRNAKDGTSKDRGNTRSNAKLSTVLDQAGKPSLSHSTKGKGK